MEASGVEKQSILCLYLLDFCPFCSYSETLSHKEVLNFSFNSLSRSDPETGP